MKRLLVAAICAALLTPAAAQELSPDADLAMWCISAIQVLEVLGVYPPEAIDPALRADIWSLVAFEEFDAKGLSGESVEALFESYAEELSMQLPDYLVSSDPAALRHDVGVCLED